MSYRSISCFRTAWGAVDDACGFRTVQRYDVVRVTLGLLLILAAILKGHQLATEPVPGTDIFESRWLLIAAVELELVFGFWLLAGHRPRATWWAALTCFGVFAIVSAFKTITGAESCGCFGRVVVSPWYTLALDVGAIAALAFARPGVFNYEHHTVFSVTEFAAFAALLAVPSRGEEHCSKGDKYVDRVNKLPALVEGDRARVEYFLAPLTGLETDAGVRTKFFKMVSQPLQVRSSFQFE